MTVVDGQALRALRTSFRVPIRWVARAGNLSPSHLSHVERGTHGRPVTPAVIAAYERVLKVRIPELLAGYGPPSGTTAGWRPGEMSRHQRDAYASQVASLAIGGPLGQPADRFLATAGAVAVPSEVTAEDAESLCRLAEALHTLGGLAGHAAHHLLSWALTLPHREQPAGPRLSTAITRLAQRAAYSAIAANRHEAARTLFLLALFAAASASDPDLRAHVLADIAAHHLKFGYREDCLHVLRLAQGDERTSDTTRTVLRDIRGQASSQDAPGHVASP